MKKIITSMLAVIGVMAMSSQSAFAREFADIYTECGLGAMIAPNNPPVAAVTNVTWDLGTTAISSDASSAETCEGGQAKTASFIYETYPQLEKDLAQGQGEHLNALLAMAGCDASVHAALAQAMRADLSSAVSAGGYSSQSRFEQAESLHQKLYQRIESDFAGSCRVIG